MANSKPLVVVLEDDAASATALELTLRDWGAEVVSGAAADPLLSLVGHRIPETLAIIADYDLGEQPDGVAVSLRFRELAPDVRVLVLSGAFGTRAAQAAAGAGFDFMTKPARAEAITAWLERSRASSH